MPLETIAELDLGRLIPNDAPAVVCLYIYLLGNSIHHQDYYLFLIGLLYVGFAISGKRILTNAHVVEVLNEHTSVHVKKPGSTIKYKSKVQKIAHECDLAILEIDSQEFWKGMNPLELGGIPPLKKAVFVLGYSGGIPFLTSFILFNDIIFTFTN